MAALMSGNLIWNDGRKEKGNTICPSHFMAGGGGGHKIFWILYFEMYISATAALYIFQCKDFGIT